MKNPEARRRIRRHQKERSIPQMEALLADLQQRFPHTFAHEPGRVVPLKKGIYHDIRAALTNSGYNSRVISWTLYRYTQKYAYIRAVAEKKDRVDLSGKAIDTVTEEDQQQAIARLQTMRQRLRRPRQRTQTAKHSEDKSIVPDPSGDVITEAKRQSAPKRYKTTSKWHRQLDRIDQLEKEK